MCFIDILNQIGMKLNLRQDQEEWVQPRKRATNLRKANKVRRQLWREAFILRAREKEANIVRNLPSERIEETARREVTH